MGYKMLGFVVWQGARWYARRRVSQMLPSRKVAAVALVASAVATVAVVTAASKRHCDAD
jgi:hypothetical protein